MARNEFKKQIDKLKVLAGDKKRKTRAGYGQRKEELGQFTLKKWKTNGKGGKWRRG